MTTALPAQATPNDQPLSDARHLRLVGDTAQSGAKGHTSTPLVGYLLLVPEGTDPAELFAKDRPRPEIRPVAAADSIPVRQTGVRQTGDDVVRIDTARHLVEVNGRELDLTYLEFALLAHLVQRPHHVHSRDDGESGTGARVRSLGAMAGEELVLRGCASRPSPS